ncbi:LysR family transcriptional regulator [Vibrio brasiliensis]|uniref:Transcriptional regulator, LysR family protein n=1 Tax=Vibrio brasiliensis LMG 20546 TaxID=945543 RepID=E8LWG3_9VIBR|nr:LysR family transcriptional regulator [Vibrio brasiliensis]EGA65026.1 Transcriptional regulator, LysR family protein [Vibrio brasiliensis LMG 20546]
MKTVNRSIDVKYLRTFSQVAKHKSFTAAAESLFMTQPAVSQHIKKIESTIGASIFDRKDGFVLTKHGQVLLEYVDQTMSMYEKLFHDLESVELRDQFKIAIAESFCPDMVEKIINEFRALNNIDLTITSFSNCAYLDIEKYDLIFSVNRLPYSNGRSYQLNTVNYAIAHSHMLDPQECYPQRIVYCDTLNRSDVQDILKHHGVDSCFVSSWVSTNSLRLIKNELETNGTVLIFPEWSVRNLNCRKVIINQKVNMYVWCSEDVTHELEELGVKDKIQELFELREEACMRREETKVNCGYMPVFTS